MKLHLADLWASGQTLCGLPLATTRIGAYHGQRDDRGRWMVTILPLDDKPVSAACRGCLMRYQRALWLESLRVVAAA
jgi:hypothetical protein